MTKIIHSTAGRKLTQAEYDSERSHSIGGQDIDFYTGTLGASAWVVASDAPTSILNFANMLYLGGYPVYICDGTADDLQIQAAHDDLPATGGEIVLSLGEFTTTGAITVSKSYVNMRGSGYGTQISVDDTITNSLLISGDYCKISDFKVNAYAKAAQMRSTGTYITYDHIWSVGHTTYNMLIDGGGAVRITGESKFEGKPIRLDANFITIDGLTYFNGGLTSKCIEIIAGATLTFRDLLFESYVDMAIDFTTAVASIYGVNIDACHFESSGTVVNVIDMRGQGIISGRITGNYMASDPDTTNCLNIVYGRDVLIAANSFSFPVVVGNNVAGLIARDLNISFNGQTGLNYLTINRIGAQTGRKELEMSAAPTTGTWVVGDRAWNSAPTTGGAIGWTCTTAGTPGTWTAINDIKAPVSFENEIVCNANEVVYV